MSAIFDSSLAVSAGSLPLLALDSRDRVFAWQRAHATTASAFVDAVTALAKQLPAGKYAVNLCEDRYRFSVAFCAVAVAGQTNLLPSSRAPQAIAEVMHAYSPSYAIVDRPLDIAPARQFVLPAILPANENSAVPSIPRDHIVAIGFTSGSTGLPKANAKSWAGFCASSALNAGLLRASAPVNIVATVPAQHMYGLELSVLLPLRSAAAIHSGQPFFPADVAQALGEIPAPRVLVTTPFHLRALLEASPDLPEIDTIVSATASLDAQLAVAAEQRYSTRVVEVFGSTETCVIAHRRTAAAEDWQLYPGINLHPQPDGTLVEAAHFAAPTLLQDIVEILPERKFALRGRNGDLLEIAGKRASLGDLTRRLLAIPGVQDGVLFSLDADANGVRRLAALIVAPELTEADILGALRSAVDPVFLPRAMRLVPTLPRNATGKLPRDILLAALREPN